MARLTREVTAEGKTLTEGVMVPPEQLILVENSRRFSPVEEVDDSLMLSILSEGQIQDVVVRLDKDSHPVVVAGEQRVKAILKANRTGLAEPPLKVRCTIRDLDEGAAFIISVAENDARNEPSTADHAYAVKTLIERYGKTQAEVTKLYGKSTSWVSEMLSISSLSTGLLKRVHIGEITYGAAVLLAAQDKATRKLVLGILGESGAKVSREAVQSALDRLTPEAAIQEPEHADAESPSIAQEETPLPEETEEAKFLKTLEQEYSVAVNPEVEEGEATGGVEIVAGEAESVVPESKRGRGRPRMTKKEKAEKKAKKPLPLKAVRTFFEDQAKAAEGEDANVWNELCGGFGEWMDHKFGDRAMIARGKTACGLDG
jgi:ParB family chromosome partitioning protein